MKLGRVAVAALALGVVLFAAPSTQAGNGSNYLHLTNGVDYYFLKTPPCGATPGIWRCFPHEMLHSPTLVVDPASWAVGTYATKLNAVHLTVTGGTGKLMSYPVIAISGGATHCNFFTSGGSLNWGLASVAGFGSFIVGPTGAGLVNLYALIGGLAFVNPAPGAGYIVQVALNLTTLFGSPSSIAIFEGESVTLYVADDPTQCGAPLTWQYWTGSLDERNLCSSYSFLWSAGTGYVFAFVPWFEWAIGLGSIDATMTTIVQHDPAFDVGLYDAHSPTAGFSPGFDQGTGSQTLSLAGPAGLGDFLGFAVYDDPNFYGGTGRLACGNIWGYDLTAAGTCMNRPSNPSFIFFPTGGPGGPVLSAIWPQMPRCVGKIDTLFTALLANSIWVMSTNHSTAPGAMNIPWWPGSFGQNSGSNASGFSGGFPIPVPQLPVLIGLDLFFWNWATDGSNSFLDHNQSKGHALSNGYYVLFFP